MRFKSWRRWPDSHTLFLVTLALNLAPCTSRDLHWITWNKHLNEDCLHHSSIQFRMHINSLLRILNCNEFIPIRKECRHSHCANFPSVILNCNIRIKGAGRTLWLSLQSTESLTLHSFPTMHHSFPRPVSQNKARPTFLPNNKHCVFQAWVCCEAKQNRNPSKKTLQPSPFISQKLGRKHPCLAMAKKKRSTPIQPFSQGFYIPRVLFWMCFSLFFIFPPSLWSKSS